MRLATTLLVVACSWLGAAWGVPLLSDLVKATKGVTEAGMRGVQKVTDTASNAAISSIRGASDVAAGAIKGTTDAVQGAAGAAAKIARAATDSDYYSLSNVMDMYGGCLFSYCWMNLLDASAKSECEAKKTTKCAELKDYSLMDFLSYQLTQLWLKVAPGMAVGAGLAQVNSATGAIAKMG